MSNLSSSPSMKETVFTCVILCVIFLSIFSFYTFVNPIIPYDGDDWKYLGSYREPFPKWGGMESYKNFARGIDAIDWKYICFFNLSYCSRLYLFFYTYDKFYHFGNYCYIYVCHKKKS